VRYDDKEYAHYVAPKAVTFATVSQPGKDGRIGAIVGVRGVGREESNGLEPQELQALLDAVKAAGTTMLEFKPEEAHARWCSAAALYIDPLSVREIRDDGSQVNVYFEASGSLDVQTRTYDGKDSERLNVLLNELWDKRQDEFKDLNACYREAQRLQKIEEDRTRISIAESIAALNPTLTRVPQTGRAVYVHPEDFAYVTFYTDEKPDAAPEYKYSMSLERQKTANNPYPEGVRLYFNSVAARAEAFEALQGDALQKPAAKKLPPPAP
jgi:hypothetical protein